MKRGALRWNDDDDDTSSSSSSDSEEDGKNGASEESKKKKKRDDATESSSNFPKPPSQDSAKKKKKEVDFGALSLHGYRGGLSVLGVKEPEQKPDWSWSKGKETRREEAEESFHERQKTRDTLADAEKLVNVQTPKEKKNMSFQQKEKRKRDLGQASRGKNYVEEEKRLLRDSGVYSGFDS